MRHRYHLRDLEINEPNRVWCADITYIPMRRGFLYLAVVMDWCSRKVLSWRLSNSLDADFCVAALEEALARFPKPEIFNTDQGCQFTSLGFTEVLKKSGVLISMDARGRWRDNIMVERLWRSLKYESVYLHAYESGSEARNGIGAWIEFYNRRRPHQALGERTPMAVWREGVIGALADNAVDMTLRLDNADALTTCPQRQPQQQTTCAA